MWIVVVALLFISFSSSARAQVINEILPNPSGDEKLNEWIEIYNETDSDIDIAGYVLVDKAKHELIIESTNTGGSTVITSQGFLVIKDEETGLYLNNSGDEIISLYVSSDSEESIDTFSYKDSKVDKTWGRVPDGGSISAEALNPSMGQKNNPPPTPTPIKTPTPTSTPKPKNTPTPISTPTPTKKLVTPTLASENSITEENSISSDSEVVREFNRKVLGRSEESKDDIEEKEETSDIDNETKVPYAAFAFLLGGISFVGAGSYPFMRKWIKDRNSEYKKEKNEEKISL